MNKTIKSLYLFLIFFLPFISSVACQSLLGNEDSPDEEQPRIFRDGSEDYPFRIGDLLDSEDISEYYASSRHSIWVEGYIIGYVSGIKMSSVVYAAGDKESNVVIGNTPSDPEYQMPVQLSSSGEGAKSVRQELNLASNPDNLGKKVKIKGVIATYMSAIGIKQAEDYCWLEEF